MPTKIEKLVHGELDRLPAELKPFARPRPDSSMILFTLEDLADSYGKSFTQFAEELLDGPSGKHFLWLPTAFLARHSMELHLKWAIEAYQNSLMVWEYDCEGHDLKEHWKALVDILGLTSAEAADYSAYCLKLLDYVDTIDKDSLQFRYPHVLEHEQFQLSQPQLENLIKAHWHVSTYCSAACESLDEAEED